MPIDPKYIEAGKVIYANRRKPFVKRMLMGDKQPIYDTIDQSTHLMASIDNYAMPTLQYNNGQWNNLTNAGINEVFDQSIQSNNFIEFNTPQEADTWAKDYHYIMDNPEIINRVKQNRKRYQKLI